MLKYNQKRNNTDQKMPVEFKDKNNMNIINYIYSNYIDKSINFLYTDYLYFTLHHLQNLHVI